MTDNSQSKWSGTVNVSNGQDGQAVFESDDHTPVTGITSFMVDTTKPKIEKGTASRPSCNCNARGIAFNYNPSDSGSGISSITPMGLGLSTSGCYANGMYQYGAMKSSIKGLI